MKSIRRVAILVAISGLQLVAGATGYTDERPHSLIYELSQGVFSVSEDHAYHFNLPMASLLVKEDGRYLCVGHGTTWPAMGAGEDSADLPVSIGYFQTTPRSWAISTSLFHAIYPAASAVNSLVYANEREKSITGEDTSTRYLWYADEDRVVYRSPSSSRTELSLLAARATPIVSAGFSGSIATTIGTPDDPGTAAADNIDTYHTSFVDAAAIAEEPDIRAAELIIDSSRFDRYATEFAATIPIRFYTDYAVDHAVTGSVDLSMTDESRTEDQSFVPGYLTEPTTYTTRRSFEARRDVRLAARAGYSAIVDDDIGAFRVDLAGGIVSAFRGEDLKRISYQGYSVIPEDDGLTTVATHRNMWEQTGVWTQPFSWHASMALERSVYFSRKAATIGVRPKISASYGVTAPEELIPFIRTEVAGTDKNGDADLDDTVDEFITTERHYTSIGTGETEEIDCLFALPVACSFDIGRVLGSDRFPVRLLIGAHMVAGWRWSATGSLEISCTETAVRSNGQGEELSRETGAAFLTAPATLSTTVSDFYFDYRYAFGLSLPVSDAIRVDVSTGGGTEEDATEASLLMLDSLILQTTIRLP